MGFVLTLRENAFRKRKKKGKVGGGEIPGEEVDLKGERIFCSHFRSGRRTARCHRGKQALKLHMQQRSRGGHGRAACTRSQSTLGQL